MKKLWIISVIVLFVISFASAQALKERVNLISPASNAAKLGDVVNLVMKALSGDAVLFDEVTLTYGRGASDTTKLRIHTDTNCWFNGTRKCIYDTVKAFTATTHDVTDGHYATFKLSVAVTRAMTITMSASEYTTKAAAIAAVPATPANEVNLGYVIIHADGALFDASTTKLNAATVEVDYVPASAYIVSWE